jgi:hypothetical protein
MTEDWQAEWQQLVDAIGTDFGADEVLQGADAVEAGLLRRYAEPLEFGCPLHFDEETARRHGYESVVAPLSSLLMFMIPPIWSPGEAPVFTKADRDAQPARTAIGPRDTGLEPPTSGYFATNLDIECLQPVVLGDRLLRVGRKLIACEPKETSVGRGAFTKWESEIRNERGETVALLRIGTYAYNPHPVEDALPAGTGGNA